MLRFHAALPAIIFLLVFPFFLRADPTCASITGSTTFGPLTTVTVELGGKTVCSEFDRLTVTETLTLSDANLEVELIDNFLPAVGDEFLIVDVGTSISGQFQQSGQLVLSDGTTFTIDYAGGDGNDVVLTTVAVGSVLPVTLLDFTATPENKRVRLDWRTAAEEDNLSFTVKRITNNLATRTVGEVPAGDDNSAVQSYQLYDEEPVAGTNFYELWQTDFDGSTWRIGLARVDFAADQPTVYFGPNPAVTTTRTWLTGSWSGPVEITVRNATGARMAGWRQALDANSTLDVREWPAGIYEVSLRSGNVRASTRLVVVH